MCGINGIIDFEKTKTSNIHERILKMNKELVHRGPDNNEAFHNDSFALGHLRLSIIDLDERANQPMCYKDHLIVYNGEVFNYKEIRKELSLEFITDSDTEVVLKSVVQMGIDWFLKRANGFFAFAIINKKTNTVILARDRFGIKPLYYSYLDNRLIFSSEVKGILASGLLEATFRFDKIEEYLSYRFILEPNTFFEDVYQLESGTYHIYNSSGVRKVFKYWDLPNTVESQVKNESDIIKELSKKVEEAISRWALTDVPLGAFLSGGLDSSLTSAILSKNISKLKTYTIGYSKKNYNEFDYADIVARHISSDHTKLYDDLDNYNEYWDRLINKKDSPLSVPNEIPLAAMCDELKKNITVVVSGEGADELFGGYGKIFRLPFDKKRELSEFNLINELINSYSYMSKGFLSKYFVRQSKSFEDCIKKVYDTSISDNDFMYRFFHSIHIKGLLGRVDMTSMQASVEARPPFLDHSLIEYVYKTIPNSLKLKWNKDLPPDEMKAEQYSEIYDTPKYPLKKVAEKYLPKKIIYRKKMGFPVPLDDWFSSLINQLDLSNGVYSNALKNTVNKTVFIEDLKKEKRYGQSLWMLLNLQKFYNMYFKKSWKW
jgi:asparagine synthase (glutamine-hydrolysing)